LPEHLTAEMIAHCVVCSGLDQLLGPNGFSNLLASKDCRIVLLVKGDFISVVLWWLHRIGWFVNVCASDTVSSLTSDPSCLMWSL